MSQPQHANPIGCQFGAPLRFSELIQLCEATGLHMRVNNEAKFVSLFMDPESYRSPVGNECAVVNVCTTETGLLTIWAPWVYRMSQAVDRGSFLCALAEVSYRTNTVSYYYDPGDQQEVKASLQVYMIDFKPSPRFIASHVQWLAALIDARHEALARVAAFGARALPAFRKEIA
jgi:hypothetical protein